MPELIEMENWKSINMQESLFLWSWEIKMINVHVLSSLLFLVVTLVLLVLLFEWTLLPMIELMAATRAAVKFGSAVMAAVAALTLSAKIEWFVVVSNPRKLSRRENFDSLLQRAWPKTCGKGMMFWEKFGNWCSGVFSDEVAGVRVRSKVTVGNGAEAERVAKLGGQLGSGWWIAVLCRKVFDDEFIRAWWGWWSALGIEPESSIDAAADVVDAIAIAAGGSGWLCWPSYVVISMVLSSAHLCTCNLEPKCKRLQLTYTSWQLSTTWEFSRLKQFDMLGW